MPKRKYERSTRVWINPNPPLRDLDSLQQKSLDHIKKLAGADRTIDIGTILDSIDHVTNNSKYKDKSREERNYAFVRYAIDQLERLIVV